MNGIIDCDSFQQKMQLVDNKYYKRTWIGDMSWWTFENTNIMDRELEMYRICTKNNIYVPKIYNINKTHKSVNIKKINGKNLIDHFEENIDSIHILSDIVIQVANIIYKLHSIKIDHNIKLNFMTFSNYYDLICNKINKFDKDNTYTNELLKYKNLIVDNDFVISHGDFHAGNLIIDKTNNLYLIDFEESCIASRYTDIVSFIRCLKCIVPKRQFNILKNTFINTYESISKINLDTKQMKIWNDFLTFRSQFISFWIKNQTLTNKLNTSVDKWLC